MDYRRNDNRPLYGQVVVGPPGSGKTTYCNGMQEYLRLLGRNAWVINLDPANEVPKNPIVAAKPDDQHDNGDPSSTTDGNDKDERKALPYVTLLDVCDSVVNLSSVMKELGLGPNGGLVYCMEYVESHVDEIVEMIRQRIEDRRHETSNNNNQNPYYLIFDLPGQVELYTHGMAVPNLLQQLTKVLDLRLVMVQLIDAHYCTEPSNFISAALLSTTTMLRLELPTVSVLSKVDLLLNYSGGGELPFSIDYFTECQDLERLLPFLQGGNNTNTVDDDYDYDNQNYKTAWEEDDYTEDKEYQKARRITRSSHFFRKHQKLHKVLAEMVEEFGLLSFLPLDISNAESVGRVLAKIDKCNGYFFLDQSLTTSSSTPQDLFECAVQSDSPASNYELTADIKERLAEARSHKRRHKQEQRHERTQESSS